MSIEKYIEEFWSDFPESEEKLDIRKIHIRGEDGKKISIFSDGHDFKLETHNWATKDTGRAENLKFGDLIFEDVFITSTNYYDKSKGFVGKITKTLKDSGNIDKYIFILDGWLDKGRSLEKREIVLFGKVKLTIFNETIVSETKSCLVIDGKLPEGVFIDELFLAIGAAFSILFGAFPKGLKYMIAFENDTPVYFEAEHRDFKLNNGYGLIEDILLESGGDYYSVLQKGLQEGKGMSELMNLVSAEDFAKIIEKMVKEPYFARIIWTLLYSRNLELEMRGSALSVAIEMLGNYFVNDTNKNKLNEEEINELDKRVNFVLSEMLKERLISEENEKYVRERNIKKLFELTNNDKLIAAFSKCGIVLNDDEEKVVKCRNVFLHGRLPEVSSKKILDVGEMKTLYSDIIIVMDMLLVRAILTHLGIQNRIIDYVKYHSKENMDKKAEEIVKEHIPIGENQCPI